jgi:rubrerythrin
MMCGIDTAVSAIRKVSQVCEFPEADQIINRLEYHRAQAEGMKPKYHPDQVLKDYYTCRNCGHRVIVNDNYCPNCGYMIKWDSCRCLTGLPLVDIAEGKR